MNQHWFFWAFVVFFILHELIEQGLTWLNMRHIKQHRGEIPSFYKDKIEPAQYAKSIDYTLEKLRFGILTSFIAIPVVWAAIFSGFFDKLDSWISVLALKPLLHSVVFVLATGLILMVLKIPQNLYSHFVIEEKYGFNKMTLKIWAVDFVKGLMLSAVLGVPLLTVLFWLFQKAGPVWWIWSFGALFAFQFFIYAVYPVWIAPLFNKFTPLADGELKRAILDIASRIRFKLSGIYTIDGSKRSSHSNAYFAGIGRFRRIVLFDTLADKHTLPEIIGVLAHEMGHNIKKHVQRQLIFSFVVAFAGFWILSRVIGWEPFYAAFNAGAPTPHKALVLFSLFSGTFTFWLTPISNALSRKYEFEADRFSVETTKDKISLASALIKLSKENLSNLTPHPLYSFYHYSHPTTVERVKAILD